MATSVTWVQDANGNFEVSSTNHLLELMNPSSANLNVSYVQTVDIDLAGEEANIFSIGNSATPFTGDYDGQGYSVSNWSNTATGADGLFGVTTDQCVLKNLVLDGVWILLHDARAGFLCPLLRFSTVYNITTNFAPGTRINGAVSVGVVVGYIDRSSVSNVTVGGTIDECTGSGEVGGIVGACNGSGGLSYFRNIATFTAGIVATGTGSAVGGIVGLFNSTSGASYFMNAMTGDIVGTGDRTGGVVGRLSKGASDIAVCMRGNITSTSGTSGGIAGETVSSASRALNYMTGDVTYALAPQYVSSSVVAMRGNVTYAGTPAANGGILLDTSYGIVAQNTDNTVNTMDLSSFDAVNEDGLPFFLFDFTDQVGNVLDWEFIYGNTLPLELTARPLSIEVKFNAVNGAVAYKVTNQEDGGGKEVTVRSGLTNLELTIKRLVPETTYVVRLYSTSDGTSDNPVYTLAFEQSATTLVNVVGNHESSHFLNEKGVFDISDFDQDSLSTVVNEVFTTGDKLIVPFPRGSTREVVFVKKGDPITVGDNKSLLFPFEEAGGVSQSASLVLSDATTVTVTYDEVNQTIAVGGEVYSAGEHTIIDGKKVTVTDI